MRRPKPGELRRVNCNTLAPGLGHDAKEGELVLVLGSRDSLINELSTWILCDGITTWIWDGESDLIEDDFEPDLVEDADDAAG